MAQLWLCKADAADLLGKGEEFVRQQILPRLPDSGKRQGRGRGRPWQLLGSAVVVAYAEYLAELTTGDPESFSVSSSPAMERQRLARAKLLEWELAERRGELVSTELFRRVIDAAMLPLRRFAEQQIIEHGNGTADAWDDAVGQFEREIRGVIGVPIDDDGETGVSQAAEPTDGPVADADH